MFKAVCVSTGYKVIVKAYYKSKMHPKHYHKLYREIESMKVGVAAPCLGGLRLQLLGRQLSPGARTVS